MSVTELPPLVAAISSHLRQCLNKAHTIKSTAAIDPPLHYGELSSDVAAFKDIELSSADSADDNPTSTHLRQSSFETAARAILYEKLAANAMHDDSFVDVWNLLDIIQACADQQQCDAGLTLWLVEEMLDSQTIEGCRGIFDYLESRRERLAASGLTGTKRNTILRTCNELLHRLSRAEDAVFCGRVFTFLFQMFPLGDKSAVNLRGEYHVENVTTFDEKATLNSEPAAKEEEDGAMEVDGDVKQDITNEEAQSKNTTGEQITAVKASSKTEAQSLSADIPRPSNAPSTEPSNAAASTTSSADKITLTPEALYPTFWSLQGVFSNPPAIFDNDRMTSFKGGMELALDMFKQMPTMPQTSSNPSRGHKRKRGSDADRPQDSANTFNPKYLTSPELFKLELGDLTFQRHILVQALILIDFMLSMTPKAKKKNSQVKIQKAMDYSYTLSDQDAQWATKMRSSIMSHLAVSPDGRFYNRMVENVLSRDKNWLRWKMESCPPIEKPPLPTQDYTKAQTTAKKACTSKRLRSAPMGALQLDFMSTLATADKLQLLTEREGPAELTESGLLDDIKTADLELEMEDVIKGPVAWMDALDKRASKSWRALRMARKGRFDRLSEVDESESLDALVAESVELSGEEEEEEAVGEVETEAITELGNGVEEAEMEQAEVESIQAQAEAVATDVDVVQADLDEAQAMDTSDPVDSDAIAVAQEGS